MLCITVDEVIIIQLSAPAISSMRHTIRTQQKPIVDYYLAHFIVHCIYCWQFHWCYHQFSLATDFCVWSNQSIVSVVLYTWLFWQWFYFVNFVIRTSRKFPLQFMSIYSDENIRKIVKLSPREFPHLVPKPLKYLYGKIMVYTVIHSSTGKSFKMHHSCISSLQSQKCYWILTNGNFISVIARIQVLASQKTDLCNITISFLLLSTGKLFLLSNI